MDIFMKYESEFRIKDKELYRTGISHKQAIEQLANIVKEADNEIERLVSENHKLRDECNDVFIFSIVITGSLVTSIWLSLFL